MKKLISVALVFLMVVSLLASCGKKNQTLKEAKVDGFVDRFVDAAKEAAKTDETVQEPEVEVIEWEKYNETQLTYNETTTIEIYSDPVTETVNGVNLRVYTKAETRDSDVQYFLNQVKSVIKMSDPKASDSQINNLIDLFTAAVPDPAAEGYTGVSARTEALNDISYMVYYDFTTEPGVMELLVS